MTRLAIATFEDATNQRAGERVTRIFDREIADALGKDHFERLDESEPRGMLDVGQTERALSASGADGLVVGRVLAFAWQQPYGRVWVSIAVRLLSRHGRILWTQNVTGARSATAPSDALFDSATRDAAKEFIHDLMANPA